MHGGVGAGDCPAHGDHQPEGELGDGDGIGAGCVHDDDALAGSGIGVDVVDAHTGATDDAEFGGRLEQLGVSLHSGADDECVGVGELCGKAVLDLVGRDYVPAGLLLEDGEGGGRDFFSEDDLHSYQNLRQCSIGSELAEIVRDE